MKKKTLVKKIAKYRKMKDSLKNPINRMILQSEEIQSPDLEMIATKNPETLAHLQSIPRGPTQTKISCYFGSADLNRDFESA